jgi:hypothetical protein
MKIEHVPAGYWVGAGENAILYRAGYRNRLFHARAEAAAFAASCDDELRRYREESQRRAETFVIGEWDHRCSDSDAWVACLGCGGKRARAECSAKRLPSGSFVFACSPECEEKAV